MFLRPVRKLGLALIGLMGLAACSAPLKTNTLAESERKVRYGDVVEITFPRYPEFNQSAMVMPDGTVRLLGLGSIKVRNLSQSVLEALVAEQYRRILSEPAVSVNVLEASNFSIFMAGDLKKPGIIKFREDMTIVQGILLAGGLIDKSVDHEVVIFRDDGKGGVKIVRFEIRRLDKSDDRKHRLFKLAPYDVVFVMKASGKGKAGSRVRI